MNFDCLIPKLSQPLLMAVLLVLLASCANRSEQAAEYNDRIIGYEGAIMKSFDVLDSAFKDPTGSFEKLDREFVSLHNRIKQSKLAIDSVGPFRHDPNLQNAARQLFSSLDRLVDTDYRKLISLVRLSDSIRVSPAIADSESVIRHRIQERFSSSVSDFINTQKEFGKKYNVILK